MRVILIIILLIKIINSVENNNNNNEETELSEAQKEEELYKRLFKRARAEQVDAIKNLRKLNNINKLHQMILLMGEKVFAVILESRARIEASPYIPGVSDFPLDEKIKDALSNILENTALFSEIILRFPDISASILKANNNWDILLQWSIAFCNQVKYLLDNSTLKLLSLVSQELNHIPRSPNYFNPYKKQNINNFGGTDDELLTTKKKKKKKEIKKGPHLSHWGEL